MLDRNQYCQNDQKMKHEFNAILIKKIYSNSSQEDGKQY